MRSHRSPTSSSHSSKYSNNFQLVKQKIHLINPNPQQIVHSHIINPSSNQQQINRYDYSSNKDVGQIMDGSYKYSHFQHTPKKNRSEEQRSLNYRVRKSAYSHKHGTYTYTHTSKQQNNNNEEYHISYHNNNKPLNSLSNDNKSQNYSKSKSYDGGTVYEIYNTKNNNYKNNRRNQNYNSSNSNKQPKEQDKQISLVSKSEVLMTNYYHTRNFLLKDQTKLQLPIEQNLKIVAERIPKQKQQISYVKSGQLPANKQLVKLIQHHTIIPQQQSNNSQAQTQLYLHPATNPFPYNKLQRIYLKNNNNYKTGLIYTQKAFKKQQQPLFPSQPQQYKTQILYTNSTSNPNQLQYFPAYSPYQDPQLIPHNSANKTNPTSDIIYQKDFIKHLGERTRYTRYRHLQKLKQKIKNKQISEQNNSKIHKIQNAFISKQPRQQKIDFIDVAYGSKIQDIIKIMHHPSTNRLKISVKAPKFFHSMPDTYLPKEELLFKAEMFFQQLGLLEGSATTTNSSLLKINPIQIITHPESVTFLLTHQQTLSLLNSNTSSDKKYVINWYNDSSVYAGEIKNDVRQGVGLEWVPGVYVYYGQYEDNFRHGYGVIKYNNMEVYIGLWSYDCYHGYGKILGQDGWVKEEGVWRDGKISAEGRFGELS